MEVFVTVVQVVAPIFAAIVLGIVAKKRTWVTAENVQGFQNFVMKIGLPCVIFNSCLTAEIGVESLTSMGLMLPALFLAADADQIIFGPEALGDNVRLAFIIKDDAIIELYEEK